MRLSDLQSKKIINISTGKNIGNIIDCEISDNGTIRSFITYQNKGILSINRESDTRILWNEITKIGEDVILVKKN